MLNIHKILLSFEKYLIRKYFLLFRRLWTTCEKVLGLWVFGSVFTKHCSLISGSVTCNLHGDFTVSFETAVLEAVELRAHYMHSYHPTVQWCHFGGWKSSREYLQHRKLQSLQVGLFSLHPHIYQYTNVCRPLNVPIDIITPMWCWGSSCGSSF